MRALLVEDSHTAGFFAKGSKEDGHSVEHADKWPRRRGSMSRNANDSSTGSRAWKRIAPRPEQAWCLSLARAIVLRHEGRIALLDNAPGLRVRVTLRGA